MEMEIKKLSTLGGKMMVVRQVHTFNKTHPTVLLRLVHLIVHKLYLY